jgi:hypothetical protein
LKAVVTLSADNADGVAFFAEPFLGEAFFRTDFFDAGFSGGRLGIGLGIPPPVTRAPIPNASFQKVKLPLAALTPM